MDETLYNRVEHADGRVEFIPKRAADLDWVPSEGTYISVACNGEDLGLRWDGDELDLDRLSFHNAFKTHQEARKASALMSRSNAMIRACLLVDPDFEPDWDKRQDKKYCVIYSNMDETWKIDFWYSSNANIAYVSSREKAKQVCQLLTKWGVV